MLNENIEKEILSIFETTERYSNTLKGAEKCFEKATELLITNFLEENLDQFVFNYRALTDSLIKKLNIEAIFTSVLEDVEEKACEILEEEFNIYIE